MNTIGQAALFLGVHEQVEDLGLDGHVQGGYGFVGHDEFRVHHQGPGQADALALAAGKFVGVDRSAQAGSTPTWRMVSATRSRMTAN